MPLETRQLLRIQWQLALQHEDREQRRQADRSQAEQRQAVALPRLLAFRIDTGRAIAQSFQRPKQWSQPGTLAFHGSVQIAAEPWGRNQYEYEKGRDQPVVMGLHATS